MAVEYRPYTSDAQMDEVIRLIDADLSEPYSVFTYRYFLNGWPNLTLVVGTTQAYIDNEAIGTIVSKLDQSRAGLKRGYIAMLAVKQEHRKKGIGKQLVKKTLDLMRSEQADEVVLEAEYSNTGALTLYEGLGFTRDKRLQAYYLNGSDAFRLKLWLK